MKHMKITSLASVLTVVLGITAAYAATPTVTTSKAPAELNTQTEGVNKQKFESNVNYEDGNHDALDDVKSGLRKADNSIRATADDIKAMFINDTGGKLEPVMIRTSSTAHGMIDQPVLNPQGKEIAELKDIIIDKNGNAILAVVSDGGFLGIGDKVAAFDFSKVVARNKDGKVVMALSQSMIDEASTFSYNRKDQAKSKVIPAGSFSVNELIDGELLDNKGDKVASIENISFENGRADRVIVGFHKKLGMGGDLAALNYAALEKERDGGDVDLRMNAKQSAQFSGIEKTSMK